MSRKKSETLAENFSKLTPWQIQSLHDRIRNIFNATQFSNETETSMFLSKKRNVILKIGKRYLTMLLHPFHDGWDIPDDYEGEEHCLRCGGSGFFRGDALDICCACKGTGYEGYTYYPESAKYPR